MKVLFMCVVLCFVLFFQLKEETSKDYSFPAGLEDHVLEENMSPNTSISALVPSELTQSNTSLGSSSSSGDIGKSHYSAGIGRTVLSSNMCLTFPFSHHT